MASEGVLLLKGQLITAFNGAFRIAGFRLKGESEGVVQHDHKGEARIGRKLLRVLCHCWCNTATSRLGRWGAQITAGVTRGEKDQEAGMDYRRQG